MRLRLIMLLCLCSSPIVAGKISIIIDDVGDNRRLALRALKIHPNITLSVLPSTPFSKEITQVAKQQGNEIMLHQPMESLQNNHLLGPGPILSTMSEEEVKNTLQLNLDNLEGVIGINNHMGSKLTQDSQKMAWVMSVLVNRDKFFIDSRTSAQSIASKTAQIWHVPNLERQIFLDHEDDPESITEQFNRLISIAHRLGHAIAIGHPRPNTLAFLEQAIPHLESLGLELTPISEMVFQNYLPNSNWSKKSGCYNGNTEQRLYGTLKEHLLRHQCPYNQLDLLPTL